MIHSDGTRTEDDLRHALALPPDDDAHLRLAGFVRGLAASAPSDASAASDVADANADAADAAGPPGVGEVLPLLAVPVPRRPARSASRGLLVAAAVVVLALGAVIAIATGRTTAPSTEPAADPPVATRPTVRSTVAAPAAADRVGKLIRTDVSYQSGKLTLWMGRDQLGALTLSGGYARNGRPVSTFVSQGGTLDHGTGPVPCGAPTDLDAGFHCGQDAGGLDEDHHLWLIVGYVVGDVSTVRVTVDGKVHTASTAAWSQNARVHVYWAPGPVRATYPPKGSGIGTVGAMVALDAHGKVVARARNAVAHG